MTRKDEKSTFRLDCSEDEPDQVAYLKLPTYPQDEIPKMSKSVRLVELIGKYDGPDLVFDFDEDGVLVGVEILV